MEKLLNWSELSRLITKGDRGGLRYPDKMPKKHRDDLNRLFRYDLPRWWNEVEKEIWKNGE